MHIFKSVLLVSLLIVGSSASADTCFTNGDVFMRLGIRATISQDPLITRVIAFPFRNGRTLPQKLGYMVFGEGKYTWLTDWEALSWDADGNPFPPNILQEIPCNEMPVITSGIRR